MRAGMVGAQAGFRALPSMACLTARTHARIHAGTITICYITDAGETRCTPASRTTRTSTFSALRSNPELSCCRCTLRSVSHASRCKTTHAAPLLSRAQGCSPEGNPLFPRLYMVLARSPPPAPLPARPCSPPRHLLRRCVQLCSLPSVRRFQIWGSPYRRHEQIGYVCACGCLGVGVAWRPLALVAVCRVRQTGRASCVLCAQCQLLPAGTHTRMRMHVSMHMRVFERQRARACLLASRRRAQGQ